MSESLLCDMTAQLVLYFVIFSQLHCGSRLWSENSFQVGLSSRVFFTGF